MKNPKNKKTLETRRKYKRAKKKEKKNRRAEEINFRKEREKKTDVLVVKYECGEKPSPPPPPPPRRQSVVRALQWSRPAANAREYDVTGGQQAEGINTSAPEGGTNVLHGRRSPRPLCCSLFGPSTGGSFSVLHDNPRVKHIHRQTRRALGATTNGCFSVVFFFCFFYYSNSDRASRSVGCFPLSFLF